MPYARPPDQMLASTAFELAASFSPPDAAVPPGRTTPDFVPGLMEPGLTGFGSTEIEFWLPGPGNVARQHSFLVEPSFSWPTIQSCHGKAHESERAAIRWWHPAQRSAWSSKHRKGRTEPSEEAASRAFCATDEHQSGLQW